MRKALLLLVTHAAAGVIGFASGIYLLPILTAQPAPAVSEAQAAAARAKFRGEFRRICRTAMR